MTLARCDKGGLHVMQTIFLACIAVFDLLGSSVTTVRGSQHRPHHARIRRRRQPLLDISGVHR